MSKVAEKTSRQLSYVLRHKPEDIGLTLEPGGWVRIDLLLRALKAHGHAITRAVLDEIVAGSDKKRFTIALDREKMRAAQGHSFPVDLGLEPIVPKIALYHGTASRSLDAIFEKGLLPMGRDKVHLSTSIETARAVGARHGKPVILLLDVTAMVEAGQEFWMADNGVFLTDAVQPRFLTIYDDLGAAATQVE